MVPDHVTMADDHVTVAPGHVTMTPDIVTVAPGHVAMAPDHVGTWVFGGRVLHVPMTLGSQMFMYHSALTVFIPRGHTSGFGQDNRIWRRHPDLEKTTAITRLKVRLHLRKARQETAAKLGSGDSSVVRAPDSWSYGLGIESLQERRENISSPGSTFCADSYFGICYTPVLPQ